MINRTIRQLLAALLAAASTGAHTEPNWHVLGSFSKSVVERKGTMSEYTYTSGYTLLRRGTEICGEWYDWSSKHMREVLVVGRIQGNTLEVKECSDQAESCELNSADEGRRLQLSITATALEDRTTSAARTTLRYRKHKSTASVWETNMPLVAPTFFASCNRDG
jgi:hypothetical protein